MPIPLWLMAAGSAGLGLLKSEFIDHPNEMKDREMQATTDRYSPWTGMRGKMVEHTDPVGTAAAMGAQGLAQGASMNSAESQDTLNQAIAAKLGLKGGADAMNAGATRAAQGVDQGSTPAQGSLGIPGRRSDYGQDNDLAMQLIQNALRNRHTSGIG